MKYLVVAHYNENLEWLNQVPKKLKQLVITNGTTRPNTGREAGVFFFAMQQLYEQIGPKDTLYFVQGNPFDHCADLIERFQKRVRRYTPLGNTVLECDLTGAPHHPGLPIADSLERWFNAFVADETIQFVPGAQFAITGAEIIARPKEFYAIMEKHMEEEHAPWVMERIWPSLFG